MNLFSLYYKNMNKIHNNNLLIAINIVVCILLYFILINIIKYSYLSLHDYIYPYFTSRQGRLSSQIGSYLFLNLLPKIFNCNPNDFKSIGFGGIIIYPFIYFLICWIYPRAFFISINEKINFLKQKNLFWHLL